MEDKEKDKAEGTEEVKQGELSVQLDMNELTLLFIASQELLFDGYLNGDEKKMNLGVTIGNIMNKIVDGTQDMMNDAVGLLILIHKLDEKQVHELNDKMGEIINTQGEMLGEAYKAAKELIHKRREEEEEKNGADAESDKGITRVPRPAEEDSK